MTKLLISCLSLLCISLFGMQTDVSGPAPAKKADTSKRTIDTLTNELASTLTSPAKKAKEEKTIKCTYCELKFSTQEKMETHFAKHRYPCSTCNYLFTAQQARREHEKRNLCQGKLHQDPSFEIVLKPFKCQTCSFACSNRSDLDRHEVEHTKGKTSRCDDCGHLFASADLEDHKKKHKHLCNNCGKRFTTKPSLRKHKETKCLTAPMGAPQTAKPNHADVALTLVLLNQHTATTPVLQDDSTESDPAQEPQDFSKLFGV